MGERRWVGAVSVAALVLLVATTVAGVLVSRRQLQDRLASTAAVAAASARNDVELNLQRDVAAAVALSRSLPAVTSVDAQGWSRAVAQVARAGVFAELGAASLLVVTTSADLDATLAALPDGVRTALDLRLGEGPVHAIATAVWPAERNRAALGFDVFLNPLGAPAARAATRWGSVQSTRPLRVVQETEEQRSTIVYVPITEEPGGPVTGLISLVFRAEAMLEDTVERLPRGTAVAWADVAAGLEPDDALLADVGEPAGGAAVAVEVFATVGRTFRIEVAVPPSALSAAERRVPWLVGALGAALSVGFIVTSSAWRRSTRRADELASRRTAALAATTAELEVTNRELLELDRLKDRMLGTVSHDLRSPLTVIRGVAELLIARPDVPSAQQRELLGRVLRQTNRLAGLVDELLVAAQVRSGALQPDRRPLRLEPLVDTVTADLGAGTVTRPDAPLPEVHADQVHVERILHNLLTNAVKHGAPPIEVMLAEVAGGEAVEVVVHDHGPGVPRELRERVFTEFGRTADAGPGYGLGLAIATDLASANGGSLHYRDHDGPGACFVLTLPTVTGRHGRGSVPAPEV